MRPFAAIAVLVARATRLRLRCASGIAAANQGMPCLPSSPGLGEAGEGGRVAMERDDTEQVTAGSFESVATLPAGHLARAEFSQPLHRRVHAVRSAAIVTSVSQGPERLRSTAPRGRPNEQFAFTSQYVMRDIGQ